MTYHFKEQNAIGRWGESILDSYLQRNYFLEPADRVLQDQEIDRIARPKTGGRVLFLEYKTDLRADETGNAFIETIGADANRKNEGWATKSGADFLIYYLPYSGRIFIVPIVWLRRILPAWSRYPTRQVPNKLYYTHGLLVPLTELAQISVIARIPSCQPESQQAQNSNQLRESPSNHPNQSRHHARSHRGEARTANTKHQPSP